MTQNDSPSQFKLDVVEKILLIAAYGILMVRFIGPTTEQVQVVNLLFLISEATVVGFVLVRRQARALSCRYIDWFAAFAGTGLPLLAGPISGHPVLPLMFCAILMIVGLFTQIAAKLVLRRSFGLVAANRGVKISGPYRFVRHPMYAGYFLSEVGFLLAGPTLWNCIVFPLCWTTQIIRILAEERLLAEDGSYRQFAMQTRYRLIPGLF